MSEVSPTGNHPKDERYDDNRDDDQDERLSILTVARIWLPWCLGLIFVLTIAWTTLVAWTVLSSGEYTGVPQMIVAIVSASAPGEFLIIIYSLMTVTALEYGGSLIVVTAKYLTNKWVKPLQDKFREQGREQGLAQGHKQGLAQGHKQGLAQGREQERQFWIDRERRRAEAEAKGIPFDEPFPDMGDEPPSDNGTANRG